MANEIDKLGPKDFITGCLVIVVAVFVVPILVLLFKVSIYLAIVIAVIVAVILESLCWARLSGSSFLGVDQTIRIRANILSNLVSGFQAVEHEPAAQTRNHKIVLVA